MQMTLQIWSEISTTRLEINVEISHLQKKNNNKNEWQHIVRLKIEMQTTLQPCITTSIADNNEDFYFTEKQQFNVR